VYDLLLSEVYTYTGNRTIKFIEDFFFIVLNRVLRRIFWLKRDEVTGEWRKLQNGELNDLNSSFNILRVIKSRRMRCVGHVARMGEGRGVYRVLVGNPEEKKPVGRPKLRWEDNIKMDLQEVGCGGYELD